MEILRKNLLILASAGSGKTFQLGNRVIGLVAQGVEPERIVALTFTRKAAGEFADSVLTKLANAANDDSKAAILRAELSLPTADFGEALERVVRALPKFTLGTMDSFFSKIVRGFQYELGLTGGKFDLLEGPRAAAIADEMLTGILGDALVDEQGEAFFHAFRRATIGREDQGVLKSLRKFVGSWQERYREASALEWGPDFLVRARLVDWPEQKTELAARALRHLDDITFTRKGQRETLEKAVSLLENHVIGSGSLAKMPSLLESIVSAVASESSELTVKSYKEFTIAGPAADALRDMVLLAAECELAAAVLRTRAVREVVAVFDDHCERRLRRNGKLGFNDVKILMGEWTRSEDARLRREAVDFRLDSRYDHWLLDEFQDTSRADWAGLLPLIDEAASAGDGSMFIVGDRKQAIYAWRGGDVRLFDEVMTRYSSGLDTESMEESWRSCREVLALVNRVCGDKTTMQELFGDAAQRWQWEDHVSAKPLTTTDKRGEARVERVGEWEDRLDRLAEILEDLGVGQRAMTCGVLLRGNEKVREVADELRARGFDVIEEGRREPAKDSPVGVLISNLLQWLANPADVFARGVLEMSPLWIVLKAAHGENWSQIWENLTQRVSRAGFAKTVSEAISPLWPGWSDFGRRRAGDLLSALADLDARGEISPVAAADWITRLEISQSPGVAAVQVMTIHKAKGLGFDVVVLPEIPDLSIPQTQHFDVAEGDGWICQTPPKWVRGLIPEMQAAEQRWANDECYQAFCVLYVALTRAKRGLYVLLDLPPEKPDHEKPSLANWIARTIDSDGSQGIAYQSGAPDWAKEIPMMDIEKTDSPNLKLGATQPRRMRIQPSRAQSLSPKNHGHQTRIAFGREIHALLESIAWIDESFPPLPTSDAGKEVARLLENPAFRDVFQRQGRRIELFREQAIDALIDGKWMSGVMDRLHVHRDSSGKAERVEIIDFKTESVSNPELLADLHSAQMTAYRTAIQRIYPSAKIDCLLISSFLGLIVTV